MIQLPKEVEVVEVSPRDGIQSLPNFIPTEQKLNFIRTLQKAGFKRIEVTSFVSPKHVPQMMDAEAILDALRGESNFEKMAVALNEKGYERAIQAEVDWICYVIAATETMSRRNANTTVKESLKAIKRCIADAHKSGIRVRASIAVSWVCPYEGKVPKEKVLDITYEVAEADEIAYNDTIGRAVPIDVYELCYRAKKLFPEKQFAGHFHDTNSAALANIYAAMTAGWTIFDAATGGLGGCPFSPRAKGNVATESLVWMLNEMGIKTMVDYEKLKEASQIALKMKTLD